MGIDWSDVVRDAKERLAQIEAEREHLLGVVRHAEALTGMSPRGETGGRRQASAQAARSAPAMSPTREAVLAILKERGAPIETRDLLPLVRERGVQVGGKDPIATLSARLSNSDEFKTRRGVGWWFSGQPYPGDLSSNEAEGQSVEGQPSASNSNQGGSENAAALVTPVFD